MICLYKWLSYLLVSSSLYTASQDSSRLLLLASQELESGFSTSQILTDTSFIAIHPNKAFRLLIRKYSGADPLTITGPSEPGEKILVTGYVRDKQAAPIRNAMVYCYQTDDRGYYAMNQTHVSGNQGDRLHARLFGYVRTDANGRFVLHTIHPRGYPMSSLPSHIHCEVEASGYNTIITELLFDEDPRLQGDQRNRSINEGFLIAKAEHNSYIYLLEMHKDG
ncbi:MAG: hypothetical protein ACHQEM_00435 [Chitinophagales bacterium]